MGTKVHLATANCANGRNGNYEKSDFRNVIVVSSRRVLCLVSLHIVGL
jgi:hypothetical protein